MGNESVVGKFPARSPKNIVENIVQQHQDSPEKGPLVSLWLRSGAMFQGRLLRMEKDAYQTFCTMSPEQASGDIVYISLQELVSVQVHSALAYSKHLSEGAVARSPYDEPPSKLSLRRSFEGLPAELQDQLKLSMKLDLNWEEFPSEPDAFYNLDLLRRSLLPALQAIARDSIGREALEKLGCLKLIHRDQKTMSAARESNQLQLFVNLMAALPDELDRELEKRFSEAL
jgi:hypothetical protein